MDSKPFQFKQFRVVQNHTTHKVGTDGVLIGAWVSIGKGDQWMLDIGTGTGLIALMLAQRSTAKTRIDAVEIEAVDAQQAQENVVQSQWPEKIRVHHTAVQQYFPERSYDLIVTNPPYFVNSLLPPEEKRSQARHTHQLSFEDLLNNTARLLTKRGRLALILPYAEGLNFIRLACGFQLFPLRRTIFRTRSHKPPERVLVELGYEEQPESATEIILYVNESERWSEEYQNLTQEFYIGR
ncbi:MAG TPA: methyltransferase [Flavitalea sp.]|nr:methyltransferase [Flavitalea sp.]